MNRLPTAAALAILLVTAGVAGVVSADPNGTDTRTNATAVGVSTASTDDARSVPTIAIAPEAQPSDTGFEEWLAHRLARFDLTDGQVRVIVTEASRLHDDGASRLVVRSSVVMNLYEFGVDAPFLDADENDRPGAHERFHRYVRSLDLTAEQARTLHAMVHRLYDDGATRAEIRRAIHRQLAAWDVDASPGDGRPDGVDRFVDALGARHDLTDAQTAEVERLVRGMLEAGHHRGEIFAAVERLLASYGVEDPVLSAGPRSADVPARGSPVRAP